MPPLWGRKKSRKMTASGMQLRGPCLWHLASAQQSRAFQFRQILGIQEDSSPTVLGLLPRERSPKDLKDAHVKETGD